MSKKKLAEKIEKLKSRIYFLEREIRFSLLLQLRHELVEFRQGTYEGFDRFERKITELNARLDRLEQQITETDASIHNLEEIILSKCDSIFHAIAELTKTTAELAKRDE